MSSDFDRDAAAAAMCADAAAFYRFGWLPGTSGNLSVRKDEETFLITASGKDKGRLAPSDFLLCDIDGTPAENTSHRPSAETLVHCAIYRRFPDVGAVYHVHEPYAALCSARDRTERSTSVAGLEMIKGLDIWDEHAEIGLPIVPNHHDIPTLAAAVDDLLTDSTRDRRVPAVNIDRHGFYAWGETPFEAKRHVETLAYLFRYSWEWRR